MVPADRPNAATISPAGRSASQTSQRISRRTGEASASIVLCRAASRAGKAAADLVGLAIESILAAIALRGVV